LQETGKLKVVAFFSLALKTIKVPVINTMSKTLQKRFGRSTDYDKSVIDGDKILQDCYDLIGSARDILGGRLILIECKDTIKVRKFYEDRGYINISENGDDLKQYVTFIK
jgi:hypothetical protein